MRENYEYERPDYLTSDLRILSVPYFEVLLDLFTPEKYLATEIWRFAIEQDLEPVYTYHKLQFLINSFFDYTFTTLEIFSEEYSDPNDYPSSYEYMAEMKKIFSPKFEAVNDELDLIIYK